MKVFEQQFQDTRSGGSAQKTQQIKLTKNCFKVIVDFSATETPASNTKVELVNPSGSRILESIIDTAAANAYAKSDDFTTGFGLSIGVGGFRNILQLTYQAHASNSTTFRFLIKYFYEE